MGIYIWTVSKAKWITDEIWGDKYPLWIGYEVFRRRDKMIKVCEACGSEIDNDFNYCKECGEIVEPVEEDEDDEMDGLIHE